MSDKILSFGFTLDEINTILAGLDQLPHGRVRGLIDKVQIQAAPQLAIPAEEVVAEPEGE